jgi:hypothetical protein
MKMWDANFAFWFPFFLCLVCAALTPRGWFIQPFRLNVQLLMMIDRKKRQACKYCRI